MLTIDEAAARHEAIMALAQLQARRLAPDAPLCECPACWCRRDDGRTARRWARLQAVAGD
jgi:hypothetical protein